MTENEKKQQQRIKAKKKCVKILNISCYIGTILLVLLLLLTGLTQCKGASSVSAETTTQVSNLSQTRWLLNDEIDVTSDFDYRVNFSVESGTGFSEIICYDGSLAYSYSDEDTWVYTDGYGWDGVSYKTLEFYDNIGSLNYTNQNLISWLILNGTLVSEVDYFEFNKTFNYNAPLGSTLFSVGSKLESGNWVNYTDETDGYAHLYIGDFESGGSQYNGLVIHYSRQSANNQVYIYNSETDSTYTLENGTLIYTELWYVVFSNPLNPSYDNLTKRDIVNKRDIIWYYSEVYGLPGYGYSNSTTWVVDNFRYLTIKGGYRNAVERNQLYSFNNNNQYTPANIGTGDANVFNLFSNVFTAVAPILSIMILPNITIGMLVFIPLVAALIFFIIHIIKK